MTASHPPENIIKSDTRQPQHGNIPFPLPFVLSVASLDSNAEMEFTTEIPARPAACINLLSVDEWCS